MIDDVQTGPVRTGPPVLGMFGLTHFDVEVDAQTGVVLVVEASHEGEVVQRVELTTLELDVDLPDDAFVFTPPAGAAVRPTMQMPVDVATAAGQVAFTVFEPPRERGANPWIATIQPAQPEADPPKGAQLHIHQLGINGPLTRMTMIIESDDRARMPAVDEWTAIDLDGVPAHEYLHTDDRGAELLLTRDGTHIWLRGPDRETVHGLARSLRPVSRGEPSVRMSARRGLAVLAGAAVVPTMASS